LWFPRVLFIEISGKSILRAAARLAWPSQRRALKAAPIASPLALVCACVSTDLPPLHSAHVPFELEEDEVRM